MNMKPSSSDRDAPEDFWDLGDDDLKSNSPAGGEDAKDPEAEAAIPAEVPVPEAITANPESAPLEEIVRVPRKESLGSQAPAPSGTGAAGKERPPLSMIEKASLLVLIAGLVGAAVWAITAYSKEAPQGQLVTFDRDFPIKGDQVTVAEVETWWRKPVRSGENADRGVVTEANLIPCARIRLVDSGDATLQITFRNGDRNLVGDPITLDVRDGKFAESGQDGMTIHSTSGFTSASELNAYTNGDLDPWSVVIFESTGQSTDEDPLLKVRIESTFQE